MTYTKKEERIEYVEVVRWQDGVIHVLGRGEEMILSDSTSSIAYHLIYDASTEKLISEDSFLHRGSFPLFMCGCYMLSCEGECPPLLDHDLSLKINENQTKAKKFDESIRKFIEANVKDLGDRF